MKPEVYFQFLSGLARDGINVSEIQYIGWGEPLDHPEFPKLVDIARSHHPEAYQLVHTNGNANFETCIGNAAIDEIVVSADGATPETYPRYRRGGNWAAVQSFMRTARSNRPDIRLEWKYILFDFNDCVHETDRAQQLAEAIGVDSLLFVMTNSKDRSKRYTAETLHTLPIRTKKAMSSPAAALQKVIQQASIVYPNGRNATIDHGMTVVDRAYWTNSGLLEIEGWAVSHELSPVTDLKCKLDDGTVYKPGRPLTRMDVIEVFPGVSDPNCGFKFRIPNCSEPKSLTLRLFDSQKPGGMHLDVCLVPDIT